MVWSKNLILILFATFLLSCCSNKKVAEFETKLTQLEERAKLLEKTAIELNQKVATLLHPKTKLLQVTGYSPRVKECDSTPFINAYNKKVKLGTVAVSPDLFKLGWTFGREIYIKGYGVFEIQDLMNPRHTNRVDIFFWNTERAIRFGNKHLEVTLLGA